MKPRDRIIAKPCLLLLAALLAAPIQAATDATADSLTGKWTGSGRIVVDWCKQSQLPVVITIQRDGTVTGKVGDATLQHGRLMPNRGWIGRKLNLATDYIVRGDLTGPIVAAEGVTRSSVSMPVNHVGGSLVGGVHTSGSKFGGKANGMLSSGLKLIREQ